MTVGSLFAGIGGIDLGFEQAGFRVLWANEFDSEACKTYRFNFPNTDLIEEDVRKVDFTKLSKVDVITAGFPCQPFSVCGKKKGFADERGNLFFEIMRAVDVLKPKVVFLENVANLTEHDNGRTFNIIHSELASRGYIIRYLIADACDFDIPQHRTRIYIVAFNNLQLSKGYSFPEKETGEKHIFDVIDKNRNVSEKFYLKEDSFQFRKMQTFINDDNEIYRFSDYGIQKSKDGICFTLKANMGTWYDRVPIIKTQKGIRTITPDECLALQSFPSTFHFPNIPIKNMYKQCGNSVVVELITKIARNLTSVLLNTNYSDENHR